MGEPNSPNPTVLDDDVLTALRHLTDLAPLHQPKSLAGIDAVAAARPGLPTVACFDTAFHATLSEVAYTYAIPAEWRSRWNVRRFGFHGLSHAYSSRRAAEIVGRPAAELRVVVCHLGAGASLCAVANGRSVDTTMGFTPLEGLVMATRSGSVDPGLVLWLQEHAGLSAAQVAAALEHESGLLALGGDADMRALLPRADRGDAAAVLAIDVYVHRLVAGVAAMTAALGGLDVLVFTGGVGENASTIRAGRGRKAGPSRRAARQRSQRECKRRRGHQLARQPRADGGGRCPGGPGDRARRALRAPRRLVRTAHDEVRAVRP